MNEMSSRGNEHTIKCNIFSTFLSLFWSIFFFFAVARLYHLNCYCTRQNYRTLSLTVSIVLIVMWSKERLHESEKEKKRKSRAIRIFRLTINGMCQMDEWRHSLKRKLWSQSTNDKQHSHKRHSVCLLSFHLCVTTISMHTFAMIYLIELLTKCNLYADYSKYSCSTLARSLSLSLWRSFLCSNRFEDNCFIRECCAWAHLPFVTSTIRNNHFLTLLL